MNVERYKMPSVVVVSLFKVCQMCVSYCSTGLSCRTLLLDVCQGSMSHWCGWLHCWPLKFASGVFHVVVVSYISRWLGLTDRQKVFDFFQIDDDYYLTFVFHCKISNSCWFCWLYVIFILSTSNCRLVFPKVVIRIFFVIEDRSLFEVWDILSTIIVCCREVRHFWAFGYTSDNYYLLFALYFVAHDYCLRLEREVVRVVFYNLDCREILFEICKSSDSCWFDWLYCQEWHDGRH